MKKLLIILPLLLSSCFKEEILPNQTYTINKGSTQAIPKIDHTGSINYFEATITFNANCQQNRNNAWGSIISLGHTSPTYAATGDNPMQTDSVRWLWRYEADSNTFHLTPYYFVEGTGFYGKNSQWVFSDRPIKLGVKIDFSTYEYVMFVNGKEVERKAFTSGMKTITTNGIQLGSGGAADNMTVEVADLFLGSK